MVRLKNIAAGVMLSLMMITGVIVGSTAPAAAAPKTLSGNCNGLGILHPCANVWTKTIPQPDCKVYVRAFNPSFATIPRTITFFYEGEEIFADDDFIGPGFSPALTQPPLTFGPFEDGEWRVLVTSDSTVMADETFNFSCGL